MPHSGLKLKFCPYPKKIHISISLLYDKNLRFKNNMSMSDSHTAPALSRLCGIFLLRVSRLQPHNPAQFNLRTILKATAKTLTKLMILWWLMAPKSNLPSQILMLSMKTTVAMTMCKCLILMGRVLANCVAQENQARSQAQERL